ncbi:hypothetical protein CEXT_60131 [Caerostris extrusa]|uniref:Uncharacterized protein n=1 Tax=Caerostris extrusa TaxID=172846 RepID=A0AAV4Y8B2_CAEEX|nr:hypothetical protein CEXT_60131 [Caerostris extrusa]
MKKSRINGEEKHRTLLHDIPPPLYFHSRQLLCNYSRQYPPPDTESSSSMAPPLIHPQLIHHYTQNSPLFFTITSPYSKIGNTFKGLKRERTDPIADRNRKKKPGESVILDDDG